MSRGLFWGLGLAAALAVGGGLYSRFAPQDAYCVLGFVVGWDPASVTSLEAHAADLTHVAAEGLFLGEQVGSLQGEVAPTVMAAAGRHRLPVLAVVSNYDRGWRPERVRRLCATRAARAAFAATVVREVERGGFRGVNIDFEGLTARDRAGLAALCRSLANALGPRGLLLTVDVPVGRSSSAAGAYDLGALSRACDLLVAMLYDEHGATSRPGPVASHDWALRAIASVRRSVPAAKLVAGLGAYGYDWGPTGPAEVTGFTRALTTARSQGATVCWDRRFRAPYFRYTEHGIPRQVWLEDAASVSGRIAVARRGGFAGVSVWRLGTEDPALWAELRSYRRGRIWRGTIDSPLSLADVVHLDGDGEFLTVTPGRAGGLRRFRHQGDEVVEERYPELPAAFRVLRFGKPAPKLVALTFDDGPDPSYTPRVLDILNREQVPAAFFVVGQRAAAYPELVRRIYAEGHDLGNHTYSHPNMATVSPLRARMELNTTQRLIEAITGRHTVLFRPPYDIDSRPRTRAELQPILGASQEGYVTVAANVDPADWSRHNPDEIVERCLRNGPNGGVIVLHDAGGNRSVTVQALPRLIAAFRARGCHFAALHDLVGRSRNEVMPAGTCSGWERGLLKLTVLGFSPAERVCALLALMGLAVTLLRALILPPLAWWHCLRDRRNAFGCFRPKVSVMVPAYNEKQVIGKTLSHLLASDYPDLELLVIDDGSTDGTDSVVAPFLSDPRVRYLWKNNAGKGAALNAGIRASRGEIVVAMDADTLFEPTTIARLIRRFEDPQVGAVAGNIKVGNRRGLLTQWQSVEYITAINLDKRFFDVLNCVTVVPGAVGAWRREALERVGGFSPATLAEDMDLTFAVRRAGYRIVFEPAAIAWTEAPATISSLAKQRLRWVFGTFQSLWKHRGAFLNPRAGTLGLVAMPYLLVFQVCLLLAGPLVDASILAMCLLGQGAHLALVVALFLAMEWLLATVAFAFEKEPKWPLLLVPLQRLVYRQVLYWAALKSALCVLRGAPPGWQKLARAGTAKVVSTSALAAFVLLTPATARAATAAPVFMSSAAVPAPAPGSVVVPLPDATPAGPAATATPAHLPAELFDFEEFWDLVDRPGIVVGFQAGAYLQPVSDEQGRGAAVRSGASVLAAVGLDRATTLAVERFEGKTYRPDLAGDTSIPSSWNAVKLTRRLTPGTTVSILQLTGDATSTGLTVSHGHTWGPWEASAWLWSSSDTLWLDPGTRYAGFGASISRALGRGLRLEAGCGGPLVRGQLAALVFRYTPNDGTNAAVALRRWYGKTLLELQSTHRLGARWQVGLTASSEATLSVFVKQRS